LPIIYRYQKYICQDDVCSIIGGIFKEMGSSYSRRASVESKRNIKKAYFYIFLSLSSLVLLFFLGLPAVVKFAAFFTNLGHSDKPIENSDTTPPAPPSFDNLPKYTNTSTLKIKGSSEEGANILLTLNNKTHETITDREGVFTFEVNLFDGENTLFAKAKDTSGNESVETDSFKIIFDNDAPVLEIESPGDGQTFYGAGERQIVIKGKTDTDAQIYVNEKFTEVDDGGNFSYSQTLSEGINTFEVKSLDNAQNETKTSISFNYVP